MIERKSGNVVFLSSVSVDQSFAYGGIYAATKTARSSSETKSHLVEYTNYITL